MAVRNDFSAGETLTAQDLNDTFASKLDTTVTTKGDLLTYGTDVARLGVGTNGQVLTADSGEALGIKWGEAPSGKILQVVRATDSTNRSTSSLSFVDASISVTITPQKSDSAIIIIWSVRSESARTSGNGTATKLQVTDNSNNAISGAEYATSYVVGNGLTTATVRSQVTLIAYATPATTSAVTYKGRFAVDVSAGTSTLQNATNTGQLYAIEVGA